MPMFKKNIFTKGAAEGIHATIAVLAAIEFIVTIIHSAYCCRGTCCASNTRVKEYCSIGIELYFA